MDRAHRGPVRHLAARRSSPAAVAALARIEESTVRQSVARALVLPVRLVAAALATLAAAVAGAVFVVLLPICGLASVAEGVTRASWRAARATVRVRARVTLPQD